MEAKKEPDLEISKVFNKSQSTSNKEELAHDKDKETTYELMELNNKNDDHQNVCTVIGQDSNTEDVELVNNNESSSSAIEYLEVDTNADHVEDEKEAETQSCEESQIECNENVANQCLESNNDDKGKEVSKDNQNSNKNQIGFEDNYISLENDKDEEINFNRQSNINSNTEGSKNIITECFIPHEYDIIGTSSETIEAENLIRGMPALINCDSTSDEDIKELSESIDIVEDPIAYETDTLDLPIERDVFAKDDMEEVVSDLDNNFRDVNIKSTNNEMYVVTRATEDILKLCMSCKEIKYPKYYVTYKDSTTNLCSNMCLDTLKEECISKVDTSYINIKQSSLHKNIDMVDIDDFQRRCSECNNDIESEIFAWETMDFCTKSCLAKYQKRIGSLCAGCNKTVLSNLLGKYCVRFGCILRQFCSSICLESYKKMLKVCSYCQEDMSANKSDSISRIIKSQRRDFCSSDCCDKYCLLHENLPKEDGFCRVCHETKKIEVEYFHENVLYKFCSEPCFVAFKFVNKIATGLCNMCNKYFNKLVLRQHAMIYDNNLCYFCSKTCQNIYTIAHRKIIPCCWCKVKKYNFDMIQTTSRTGESLTLCCLNCLSYLEVSNTAINAGEASCDNCGKFSKSLYHLTMSDGSIRNFCSYKCVMFFQTQFPKEPIVLPEQYVIDNENDKNLKAQKKSKDDNPNEMPIITSVVSLAQNAANDNFSQTNNNTVVCNSSQKKILVIQNASTPIQRNMSTMTKPIMKDISCEMKLELFDKACQTEILKKKQNLIPIPVPIFIPSPMDTFRLPFSIPLPFPFPLQIPVFVPITKNTSNNVLKEIKKVQVKGPSDPFEAELLMMAELVASNNKKEESAVVNDIGGQTDETGDYSPEPIDTNNTFGDDVLQMAFNMTSDYEEPAVDLEGALTANTITAPQETVENPLENGPVTPPLPDRSTRARRKYTRGRTTGKRGRRPYNNAEVPEVSQNTPPPPPPEPIEKPDANMCLKYTFGVNAWKQWVTTKNAELEKCSRRPKLFKTEILQLTSDELNYSLCLFVKEVRKPNGAEYAPDTIYYLCLGIQQYLYENGRIDNIFCDTYYEKFTDCLDEVCKKFSALYNESHYIVTRVEEEHLWESKQLGAHSPHVLLSTLMFFNTKHFNLVTVDEHMQLSFSHIMKHWKRNPSQAGGPKSAVCRNVLLRFYPPQTSIEGNNKKRRVYEQQENEDNPLRCPVKLYEFYLSKCPESVKTRNDVFYLLPERSCVPDSPVWYSTSALGRNALEKMLHRVKMVKEVNVAVLTS